MIKYLLALSLALSAAGQGVVVIPGGIGKIPGSTSGGGGSTDLLSGLLSAIPASCVVGAAIYQATDQPITTQLYACTSTNTWTRAAYTQGTSAPGTCSIGQLFFDTDATAGSNLRVCTASNTWTTVSGGGTTYTAGPSGAITITGSEIDVDTAYVPGKTTSNTWTGVNDFDSATSTAPVKSGTSLPATCNANEMYWKTDSQTMHTCLSANLWSTVQSTPGSTMFQDDEFCSSDAVGAFKLGWSTIGSLDGGQPGGVANHPCAPSLYVAGANAPVGVVMRYQNVTNSANFGNTIGFDTMANAEFIFIFRSGNATEAKYRVGLASSATEPLPTNGIYAQFSNNTGCTTTGTDTNWQFSTRAAGTSTTIAGPSFAANTWYKIRIRSVAAGTWLMSIATSGGAYSAEQSFSTNIPTSTLSPEIMSFACDGGFNYILLDYYSARFPVTR